MTQPRKKGRFTGKSCVMHPWAMELGGLSGDEAAIEGRLLGQLRKAWTGPRQLLTPLWGPGSAIVAMKEPGNQLQKVLTHLLDAVAAVLFTRPVVGTPMAQTPPYNHTIFKKPPCKPRLGPGMGQGSNMGDGSGRSRGNGNRKRVAKGGGNQDTYPNSNKRC